MAAATRLQILLPNVKLLLGHTQFSFLKGYTMAINRNFAACIKMEILEEKQTIAKNLLFPHDAFDLDLW